MLCFSRTQQEQAGSEALFQSRFLCVPMPPADRCLLYLSFITLYFQGSATLCAALSVDGGKSDFVLTKS